MSSKYKGRDAPEVLRFEAKVDYYARRLSDRTLQMFDYQNLPPTINRRDLERQIQRGYSIIARAPDGCLYSFRGGLGGDPSVYYHPTIATISNPALGWSDNLIIGTECVVIWNDDYYQGIDALNADYARTMAIIDDSIECRALHARTAFMFTCDNEVTKTSAKEYFEKLYRTNDYAVISTKPLMDNISTYPTENTSLTELIEARQYVRSMWLHEVGLEAAPNMKRERLTDDEVQIEQAGLVPICESMLRQRKKAIDDVNTMFGTSITVDFSSVWLRKRKEGDKDEID